MRVLQKAVFAFVVLAVLPIIPTVVGAQTVTAADLAQLDTSATEIDGQVDQAQDHRPDACRDVAKSLADQRDEITYLTVKMKREGTVTHDEYDETRDRSRRCG